ncbi:MAG: 50S ribosomal protein L24e [ANME-2 cluster archaeon]|nr:50S ribosomal protein L24e [ANME-2 cluster archaeon]
MELRKCSFCSGNIEFGTGKMYVKKDGSTLYFCTSKCQNNMKLGRVPRRVKWTETAHKLKSK